MPRKRPASWCERASAEEYQRFVRWCEARPEPEPGPGPEVRAARRSLGLAIVRTAEDYQAICDRMAHRAATDPDLIASIEAYDRERAQFEAGQRAAHRERAATPTPRDEARAMRDEGRTVREIADAMKVTKRTVYRWLKAA